MGSSGERYVEWSDDKKMNRSYALDALRGYAILTMILSATVVFGILPGWMYHAQTPPPTNVFNPDFPGLTWVDLVFPFFLFSMGAAFPFSIKRKIEKGESHFKAILEGFKRYFKLAFFAVFTYHLAPWALKTPDPSTANLLGLIAFVLLFPIYMRIPLQISDWLRNVIKGLAFFIAFGLILWVSNKGYRQFDPHFEDIIISIMGVMAGFGTLIYVFTMYRPLARLMVLPFLMAILIGASVEGSINSLIYNYVPLSWMNVSREASFFIPLDWLFRFDYLKYLFVIIPGSIAGEYLKQSIESKSDIGMSNVKSEQVISISIAFIGLAIIMLNLCCLYNRWLMTNFCLNILLLSIGYWILRRQSSIFVDLWKKLFIGGGCFIMLGIAFEAYQGGIKKDPTTFSYLLLTAGLAFMALIVFSVLCDYWKCNRSTSFLIMSGQNPMIAYVANALLIVPLLSLIQIMPFFSVFGSNPWLGFLQGIILTGLALIVTVCFTKMKWFWRT